jgi:hypothetical protein
MRRVSPREETRLEHPVIGVIKVPRQVYPRFERVNKPKFQKEK